MFFLVRYYYFEQCYTRKPHIGSCMLAYDKFKTELMLICIAKRRWRHCFKCSGLTEFLQHRNRYIRHTIHGSWNFFLEKGNHYSLNQCCLIEKWILHCGQFIVDMACHTPCLVVLKCLMRNIECECISISILGRECNVYTWFKLAKVLTPNFCGPFNNANLQ